jgi:cytoplasmic iron level regulating protein YaaA (DUF328/UPF0246 family)
MNCLETKIIDATGPLKPLILNAILNLYKKGIHKISARELKAECYDLDSTKDWNARLPAICNGMRNAIECGWIIISEDRNFNEFTIALETTHDSLREPVEVKNTKSDKKDIKEAKEVNNKFLIKNGSKNLVNLDWSKINDKKKNKLLIIGCSSTKIHGGQNFKNNYFSDLDLQRNKILKQYLDLLENPIPTNYFIKSRNVIGPVDNTYFKQQTNNKLFLPAVERYTGGDFYKQIHKSLYYQKNQESNLHILIISGLYGLLEFRDSIIDYQLEVNKIRFWNDAKNNTVNKAVKKYIKDNRIDNDLVFYSLSPSNYKTVLNPENEWTDLWKTNPGGRIVNSKVSAAYLVEEFLSKL